MKKLRNYQSKINRDVEKFLKDPTTKRGQIYSPTGSGKTECFGHTVHDLPIILNSVSNLNIAIVHPRIALSQDQLSRFKDIFNDQFRFTSFHSGSHINGQEIYREINTTCADELTQLIDNETRTHITFSSYDSFHKISHIEFDLLILDEAHNLVQPQYLESLQNIAAKKSLFYTATPIQKELDDEKDSTGMNNVELFGDVISFVKPKELILNGYIVPPLVHFLRATTNHLSDDVSPVDVISESFKHQEQEMKKHNMPFTQMLVASRGLNDHKLIEMDLVELWEKLGKMVPVYVIEANDARKNGKTYLNGDRFKVLQEIKESNESCIVMHYDTLSEGIDISSLTGVCILRKMSKFKLLQTIGRCGRPFKDDLNSLYEVKDMNNRKKPFSVVTFPVVDGKHIGGIDAKSISDAFIIGGYDDLTTYLTEDDKKTLSEKSDDFSLDNDDEYIVANILNSSIERENQKLTEIGLVF